MNLVCGVTVPGLSGSIDLTEYLTSGPVYNDRTGSFDFYVMNGFESWLTIRQKIVEAVHGKRIKMVLEDDPLYYYEGRFTFNEWKSEAQYSHVVINYQLSPFKRSLATGEEIKNDV